MAWRTEVRYFCCQCGREFRSLQAAERAADYGCPDCDAEEVDYQVYYPKHQQEGFQQDPLGSHLDACGRRVDVDGTLLDY